MDYNLQKNQNAEQTYHSIRNSIVSAQHRLSTAAVLLHISNSRHTVS